MDARGGRPRRLEGPHQLINAVGVTPTHPGATRTHPNEPPSPPDGVSAVQEAWAPLRVDSARSASVEWLRLSLV